MFEHSFRGSHSEEQASQLGKGGVNKGKMTELISPQVLHDALVRWRQSDVRVREHRIEVLSRDTVPLSGRNERWLNVAAFDLSPVNAAEEGLLFDLELLMWPGPQPRHRVFDQ